MESPKIVYKYYSNPAFCAQSEVVFSQKTPCITSKIIPSPDRQRMPPLGANSPRKTFERGNRITRTDISDNPLRMAPTGALRNQDIPPDLPPKPAKFTRNNNSYTMGFHRQASMIVRPTVRNSIRSRTRSEDLEMAQFRQQKQMNYERNADSDDGLEDSRTKHRYEVIRDDFDDLVDYSPTKKRIVEADADDISEYNVDHPDEHELKEVPAEMVKTINGKTLRYAIVPLEDDDPPPPRRSNVTFTSPIMSKKHLIATQKLHELLSTPRKLTSYASQPSVRITPNKTEGPRYVSTPKKPATSTPTQVLSPSKSCANLSSSRANRTTSPISPKAQQKLNYDLGDVGRPDVFTRSYRSKSHDRSLEDRMERSRSGERESRRDYERRCQENKMRDKSTAVIVPR